MTYLLLLPKNLSDTRWSARADATKALTPGYKYFQRTLQVISDDESQISFVKIKAHSLHNTLAKLETEILTVFWNDLLSVFNKNNHGLQKVDIDLHQAVALYKSMIVCVTKLGERFEYYLEQGCGISANFAFSEGKKATETSV